MDFVEGRFLVRKFGQKRKIKFNVYYEVCQSLSGCYFSQVANKEINQSVSHLGSQSIRKSVTQLVRQ